MFFFFFKKNWHSFEGETENKFNIERKFSPPESFKNVFKNKLILIHKKPDKSFVKISLHLQSYERYCVDISRQGAKASPTSIKNIYSM